MILREQGYFDSLEEEGPFGMCLVDETWALFLPQFLVFRFGRSVSQEWKNIFLDSLSIFENVLLEFKGTNIRFLSTHQRLYAENYMVLRSSNLNAIYFHIVKAKLN